MKKKCEECVYRRMCNDDTPFIDLDSTIEEIFYHKCKENSQCKTLLIEWMDSKALYMKYSNLSKYDYENYSLHDYSHSISILNAITAILGEDKIKKLRATDLWLILHCAYGHDIGMPYAYDEMFKIWKGIETPEDEFTLFFKEALRSEDEDLKKAATYIEHFYNKLGFRGSESEEESVRLGEEFPAVIYRHVSYITSEFIRRQHSKRSKEIIDSCSIYRKNGWMRVEPRFYKLVGKICMAHTAPREEVEQICKEEWDIEGKKCHPRFVAFLLRIGDLLDMDNDRFDTMALWHYGKLPRISELHKKKHDAVEHMLYTNKKVEIVARASEEEVCHIISDWFSMIHEEIEYMIFHWNHFAPDGLDGCTWTQPDTKIYLNDKLFRQVNDNEFMVNKETLIDLVIGRNLYKSQFDFLREYIQNALDAVKMKLWLDIKDGSIDFAIENKDKLIKRKRKELLPFDFEQMIFEQYRLEILCEFIENEDISKNVFRISVIDRGIGIDKECITAISNIGSGWSMRKKYAADLEEMPNWLKPTGGFGIGMQSGFMITDKVLIRTKCADEWPGREIILYSTRKSGKIEERECAVLHNGTEVIVEIPYKWFMNADNYEEYPQLRNSRTNNDFLDYEIMADYITKFFENYVQLILEGMFFPVIVQQKDREPRIIKGKFINRMKDMTPFDFQGKIYNISIFGEEGEKEVYIWKTEGDIFCHIKLNNKISENIKWFFKGVRVWTDKEKRIEELNIYKYIGEFTIDIMGMPVKDCLTVDRNKFANNFDYMGIANEFAIVYLNYIATDVKLFQPASLNIFFAFQCLLCYKYVENGKSRQVIREYFDDNDTAKDEAMRTNWILTRHSIPKQGENGTSTTNIPTLFHLCKRLWSEEKLNWAVSDTGDQELENETHSTEKLDEAIETLVGNGNEVWDLDCQLFEKPLAEELRKVLNFALDGRTEMFLHDGIIYQYRSNLNRGRNVKENKEEVFSLDKNIRQVFFTKEYYKELFVSKLPFGIEEKIEKQNDGTFMIISPIPPEYVEQDFKLKLKTRENREDVFMNFITKHKTYNLLLEWVFENQLVQRQYSKSTIEKKYKELIKYIYDCFFMEAEE